ncbi:MAG: hypothetical protein K2X47_05535 [Bdellovibrionales bacterium]|nr:hypothetical protein [Bdellovibrionales bacterium]
MSVIFRFLFCAILISPAAWAEDPSTEPIQIQMNGFKEVTPGIRVRRVLVKVKALFSKTAREELKATKQQLTEEERKAQLIKVLSKTMGRPEMEIEALIYEVQANQQLLKDREKTLKAIQEETSSDNLFQVVYGYNPANGYDPSRPLGLDLVQQEATRLRYLDPKGSAVLKLAVIRFTTNGSATAYGLLRGGSGEVFSMIAGMVGGGISAGFTLNQKEFFKYMTEGNYFERRVLGKYKERGQQVPDKELAFAKRLDRIISGPDFEKNLIKRFEEMGEPVPENRLKLARFLNGAIGASGRKWILAEKIVNDIFYALMAIWGPMRDKSLAFIQLDSTVTTFLGYQEQGMYEEGVAAHGGREERQLDVEYLLTGDIENLKASRARLELKQTVRALFGSLVNTALKIDKMVTSNYIFPKVQLATIPFHGEVLPVVATAGMLGVIGGALVYKIYQNIQQKNFEQNYQELMKLIDRSALATPEPIEVPACSLLSTSH